MAPLHQHLDKLTRLICRFSGAKETEIWLSSSDDDIPHGFFLEINIVISARGYRRGINFIVDTFEINEDWFIARIVPVDPLLSGTLKRDFIPTSICLVMNGHTKTFVSQNESTTNFVPQRTS